MYCLLTAPQRVTTSINASIQNRGGLEYVVKRHKWFLDLSELLLRDSWKTLPDDFDRVRSNLFDRIVELYKSLLRYQMKSVCAYYRINRLLTFVQDQVAWNDWEGYASEIKQAEQSITTDAVLYEALVSNELQLQHLDTTRFMLHDAARSLSNKLIASFTIPGLKPDVFMDSPNRTPAPGTCQWFREHRDYQQWQARSRGVLVVSAPPGCGKSVLSRALVHELRDDAAAAEAAASPSTDNDSYQAGVGAAAAAAVVLHFFFKDSAMQNRADLALCGMLHQLFVRRPALVLPLRDEIERSTAESLQDNLPVLWGMFVRAVAGVKGSVVCVLDGLDECERESMEALIDLMGEFFLDHRSGNLKVLLTCRPYEAILGRLAPFPSVVVLRVGDDELARISSEIDGVIDFRLGDIETRKRSPLPGDATATLREGLKGFGNRTYLWLRLVFEILERDLDRREESSLEVLRQGARTVDEAYTLLLGRIPPSSQETVHEILSLLVAAKRPFSGRELHAAHNTYVQVKNREIHARTMMDDADFATWLHNKCGFFVQVYGGTVNFIHQTAKEYLLAASSAPDTPPPSPRSGGSLLGKGCIRRADAHRLTAESCILYLSQATPMPPIDWPRLVSTFPRLIPPPPGDVQVKQAETARLGRVLQLYEEYPFAEYASAFWAYHFRHCQVIDDDSRPESLSDIRDWLWPRYFALFDKPNVYTIRMAEMALAKRSSSRCLLSPHLDATRMHWPWSLFLPSADLPSPHLLLGMECGHWRMVLKGLQMSEDVTVKDAAGRSLLDIAFDTDDVPMARLLLRQQPAKSWGLDSTKSPLFRCRSREAVNLLVAEGASVLVRDAKGNTALHAAARRGNLSAMQALVDKGVDASCASDDGSTPLHRASTPDAVDLLVFEGCPVNARNQAGDTILHALAPIRSSRRRTLEAALQNKADVNSRNKAGHTPLHLARRPWAVYTLLRHGADLGAINNDGDTPLQTIRRLAGTANGTYAVILFAARQHSPNDPVGPQRHTPLAEACHLHDDKLILKLLAAGADPHLPCPDGRPFLPYYLTHKGRNIEVLSALLSTTTPAGSPAPPTPPPLQTLDLLLAQPLTPGSAPTLLPILNLLHHHGQDFRAPNPDGSTPLHTFVRTLTAASPFPLLASEEGDDLIKVACFLLAHGADPNAVDQTTSNTPFRLLVAWRARRGGRGDVPGKEEEEEEEEEEKEEDSLVKRIVECFLSHGADANARV